MPSADNRSATNKSNLLPANSISGANISINSVDMENLVIEIKENLRLSSNSMKALPCKQLSRKSSRASPYKIPSKFCCDSECESRCLKRNRVKIQHDYPEDPYELLQKLLRDGSLVTEAVRRVQLGLTPKQRYFYESDDESSPAVLRAQDS